MACHTKPWRSMVRAVGIEPIQENSVFIGKTRSSNASGSLIGSLNKVSNKGLRQILRIWPKLKKSQKDALLSLVKAFGKGGV
jgi:hypothetical protein